MNLYLDTSVLVPLFHREATSDAVVALLSDDVDDLAVSDLAIGEFAAAIARLHRTAKVSRIEADDDIILCDEWVSARATRIDTPTSDIAQAIGLVRRFDLGLRMPDAIHAAACARLDLTLVTFDKRLARAAHTLGIDVLVPA